MRCSLLNLVFAALICPAGVMSCSLPFSTVLMLVSWELAKCCSLIASRVILRCSYAMISSVVSVILVAGRESMLSWLPLAMSLAINVSDAIEVLLYY